MVQKSFSLLAILFLPSRVSTVVLNLLGHKVGKKVKFGFSIIYSNKMDIADGCNIGHFNFIYIESLTMHNNAYISFFNLIKGPFSILLCDRAAIGKNNIINRSKLGITYGGVTLKLGKLSKLTAYHYLDLTRSIQIGDYSTLAGIRSQIWTHGYMHAPNGPGRFRVDGEVSIGNNVYIGSGSLINPGVKVADSITIGGNSTVSKSLTEAGMYVSQPLRYIHKSYEDTKLNLRKIDAIGLVEDVYEK